MNYTVSVVMITYGHEKYIEEAINGVFMQQTDFPVELIIANDCSPDQTDEVVKSLLSRAPENITVRYTRHHTNKGMNANFLWAASQATGKYIALCEGDDYWIDPMKLQKQIEFLDAHPDYALSSGYSISIDAHGKILNTPVINSEVKYFSYGIKDILQSSKFETATILFRNNPRLTFPDWFYSFGSDVDSLVLWILKDGGKVHLLNEILSIYRYHPGGATKQDNHQQKLHYYTTMLDLFDGSTNYRYTKEIKLKKEKVRALLSMHILPYWERVLYIVKQTPFFIINRKNNVIPLTWYLRYFLPK
ncbi:glycosyltransferase [Kaistella sp. PBT33-4]|uniref:glycosyltransferase family 2 protein n=1 Tax=Kaistella sp. PBT33-4 TaxID=3032000 RepID=UPI0023D8159B|nr:glycosyltransferase [Kaistella sp. PBT33-4]MDF0718780.1 glycosyltransferase [Kaistella sp. PBT33-4]